MDFDTYQRDARSTDGIPAHISGLKKVEYCIFGAMDQLGEAAGKLKKKQRDGNDYRKYKEDLAEKLGFLLWYVSTAASALNLTLESIADQNIKFNEERWPFDPKAQSEFDAKFPVGEQLPTSGWTHFTVKSGDPQKIVATSFLGDGFTVQLPFGDPVDDNANLEDGYSFHDVFHLGYYALLGWSPVVRKFWDCKRKSCPDTDRIEDGARARDREEAATTFVYKYAYEHNFFKTADTVDTAILSLVKSITEDLEVQKRTRSDWQHTIITAARVQKELMDNNGGWVYASRLEKRLQFSKSGPSAGRSR
tara:strand:+ start:2321 stop:3238 length:918 start_codon:yes stop_codon:yes gene_type:complete